MIHEVRKEYCPNIKKWIRETYDDESFETHVYFERDETIAEEDTQKVVKSYDHNVIEDITIKPEFGYITNKQLKQYKTLLSSLKKKKENIQIERAKVRDLENQIANLKNQISLLEPFFVIHYREKEIVHYDNKCSCIADGDFTNGGRSWSE